MTDTNCPGCRAPMQRRSFDRRPDGRVDIDLCFACRGIWFDPYESTQLAPAAVIELFGMIHEQAGEPRPLAERLPCPRCDRALALTHDMQRSTRITYYRCTSGDGRFTTFYQFLREKQFVREMTPAEVERLKAQVAQVKCSSCGAPIDLARDAQCRYCHMPLAILDADAVRKTLADLTAAESARHRVDPMAPMQAKLEGQRMLRRLSQYEGHAANGWWNSDFGGGSIVDLSDLVSGAIDFLMTD